MRQQEIYKSRKIGIYKNRKIAVRGEALWDGATRHTTRISTSKPMTA